MCTGAEKIQDAELEVMKVLWSLPQPVSLAELRRILSARCGWEDSTVKTLLRRLCEKGAVRLERRGMYRAVITQAEYRRWSARHLVNKVFNGSAKKLVASLLSDGQLSEAEIAELSALLHEEEST
ncbi:BlaI/MecI/CopY family transcriptional regulator [Pseudoflavonifractor phocaeensis]|uniref:BlaI/MecI/CopY family transcriptional regulator n=1 Tax=Pseudoflavonifractor phocaeensis TaxID=1870988 RepID=UPI001958EB8C|nr:BlaI/MecI/CopY family transcriptional regulator [Pseudoflavonifractor phocaeensis]MBM6870082.1 BlaI/MecI/CopY family transcriptional regulator [Pseudoflavonifractor phocaeensis]MBM6939122.1 BlaI/MecI/CopY family transcriptional regulator [Pseudoflavonifractor phocaeensis]